MYIIQSILHCHTVPVTKYITATTWDYLPEYLMYMVPGLYDLSRHVMVLTLCLVYTTGCYLWDNLETYSHCKHCNIRHIICSNIHVYIIYMSHIWSRYLCLVMARHYYVRGHLRELCQSNQGPFHYAGPALQVFKESVNIAQRSPILKQNTCSKIEKCPHAVNSL